MQQSESKIVDLKQRQIGVTPSFRPEFAASSLNTSASPRLTNFLDARFSLLAAIIPTAPPPLYRIAKLPDERRAGVSSNMPIAVWSPDAHQISIFSSFTLRRSTPCYLRIERRIPHPGRGSAIEPSVPAPLIRCVLQKFESPRVAKYTASIRFAPRCSGAKAEVSQAT